MKSFSLMILISIICLFHIASGDFEAHNMSEVDIAQNACYEELEPPHYVWMQFSNYEYPPHEATACFVKCLLGKLDFFDDKKGFMADNIVAQMTNNDAAPLEPMQSELKKCIMSDCDINKCDWALRGFNCFMENNKDAVIMSLDHNHEQSNHLMACNL